MNIFSKVAKCHCSSNSVSLISSSLFKRKTVWSVFARRISETPINTGFSPSIIDELGDIETSQSVKAYKASIVLSGETPEERWMIISAAADVLSSIFFIFILPFSFALRTESIKELVVVPNGISWIINVFASFFLILPRTRTRPPRFPSL